MLKFVTIIILCLFGSFGAVKAQEKSPIEKTEQPVPSPAKKMNQRPAADSSKTEPFDKATIEKMSAQCVKFETEAGIIEMEMFPESAPESVRSFLNLSATGAFDTTTFSRVVQDFVIQGGDLSTRAKLTPELVNRAGKMVRDEPSQIKHERGIVSLARTNEPNSATTHFFILLSSGSQLDGAFAAFGRVIKGMETVDAIGKMPIEGEKPVKPVHINRATVAPCQIQPKS